MVEIVDSLSNEQIHAVESGGKTLLKKRIIEAKDLLVTVVSNAMNNKRRKSG